MKALVTGATGYIGRHFIPFLLEKGIEVKALVRQSSRLEKLPYQEIDFVYGDITKRETLEDVAEDCELVFHLASLVEIVAPKSEYLRVIVEGTQNLIEACQDSNLKRFVFASAGMVYGRAKEVPVKEDYPCRPFYNYGRAKLLAENLLLEAYRKKGFPATIVRVFGVYGGNGGLLVDNVCDALRSHKFRFVGSKEYLFHVVHIEDVNQALLLASQKDEAIGQIYNIADDNSFLTNRRFINYIADQIGVERPNHIPVWVAYLGAAIFEKIEKIKKIIGGKGQAITSDLKKIMITRDVVRIMTTDLAADISKAKRELGYLPKYPSFEVGLPTCFVDQSE